VQQSPVVPSAGCCTPVLPYGAVVECVAHTMAPWNGVGEVRILRNAVADVLENAWVEDDSVLVRPLESAFHLTLEVQMAGIRVWGEADVVGHIEAVAELLGHIHDCYVSHAWVVQVLHVVGQRIGDQDSRSEAAEDRTHNLALQRVRAGSLTSQVH
jgi:hypothetical protein